MRALVLRLVEQCRGAGNLGAAEQPCLQLPMGWRRLLRIAVKREPTLLPLPGGERQQVQGPGVDLAVAIEAADVGMQVGDGEAAFDDLLGDARSARRCRRRRGPCLRSAAKASYCSSSSIGSRSTFSASEASMAAASSPAAITTQGTVSVSGTPSASSFLIAR